MNNVIVKFYYITININIRHIIISYYIRKFTLKIPLDDKFLHEKPGPCTEYGH